MQLCSYYHVRSHGVVFEPRDNLTLTLTGDIYERKVILK